MINKKRLALLFLLVCLLITTVFFGCTKKGDEGEDVVVEETPVRYVSAGGDVLEAYEIKKTFTLTLADGTVLSGAMVGTGKARILSVGGDDRYVAIGEEGTFSYIGMSGAGEVTPGEPDVCPHEEMTVVGRVEPTCEEKGYSGDVVCSACKKVLLKGVEMEAKGHNFKAESDVICQKGYCTQNETHYYACTVCGKVSSDEKDTYEIPNTANGYHSYTAVSKEMAKAATCADNQENYVCCSVCGKVNYKQTAEVEGTATGRHDFSAPSTSVYQAATCDHNTIYYYACSVCGQVSVNPTDTYEDPDEGFKTSEHSFTEPSGFVISEATCVSDRVESARCSRCGVVSKTETVSVPGTATGVHVLTRMSDVVAKEATCTTNRYVYCKCEYCDYVSMERTMPVLLSSHSHTYVNHICSECRNAIEPGSLYSYNAWANENNDDITAYIYAAPNDKYELVLFGTGEVGSFSSVTSSPWATMRETIDKVFVYKGITKIGDYAFAGMTNLSEVVFGSDVQTFGNYCFYGCENLGSISLPASTRRLGVAAFADCLSLSTVNWNELTQLSVVGKNAFRKDVSLTSVDLSATSLSSLGQETFAECIRLNSVSFPTSLTSIGAYCFYETALTSFIAPSNLAEIGTYAFAGCTYLTAANLMVSSLRNVGDYAFSGDTLLRSFVISGTPSYVGKGILDGTEYYRSYDSWSGSVLYVGTENKRGKECLLAGLSEDDYFMVEAQESDNPAENGWYKAVDAAYVSTRDTYPRGGRQYYEYESENERYVLASVSFSDNPQSLGLYEKRTTYNPAPELRPTSGVTYYQLIPAVSSGVSLPKATKIIAAGAFAYCTELTSVSVNAAESECEYICKDAFLYCLKLNSMRFGDDVQEIGESAFRSCDKLVSLSLPAGLQEVGERAFADCILLRSLTVTSDCSIPESALDGVMLFEIYCLLGSPTFGAEVVHNDFSEASAIKNDGTYVYGKKGGEVYLIGCMRPEETVLSLPTSISFGTTFDHYGIYDRAFHCDETVQSLLRSVTIPSSVTTVGKEAFLNCAFLTTVSMSKSVTSIGKDFLKGTAYYDNEDNRENGYLYLTATEQVNGEDVYFLLNVRPGYGISLETTSVKEGTYLIADGAFTGCSAVKNLTLPGSDKLTYIGKDCLKDCVNITTLSTPFIGRTRSTETYLAYFFGGTSYLDNETRLPASLTSVIVTGTDTLPAHAMENCANLTGIRLVRVTTYGESALSGCANATVTLEAAIDSVAKGAFKNCVGLTEASFTNDITEIGEEAFYGTGLKIIVTSGALQRIGKKAFAENPYLYEFVIGDNVVNVGEKAFSNCYGLLRVTVGASMPGRYDDGPTRYGIETNAFENCYKLVEIYNRSSVTGEHKMENVNAGNESSNGSLCKYALNTDPTKTIIDKEEGGDFRWMKRTVGTTVVYYLLAYVGSHYDKVELPQQYNNDSTNVNPYQIYSHAFAGNAKVKKVVMSSAVNVVGNYAFWNCSALTTVTISSTAARIEEGAFKSSAITSMTFPSSVKYIYKEAFADCRDLTTVSFGIGLENIEEKAFYDCNKLTAASLPSALRKIGAYAFAECDLLTSVRVEAGTSTIENYAFYNCQKLNTIYWNNSSAALTNDSHIFEKCGSEQSNITVRFGAISAVPAFLFYCGSNAALTPRVTAISFDTSSATLGEIGQYAFYGLSIRNLDLPATVRTIGKEAFAGGSGYGSVTLPDSIRTMGDGAFSGCYNLTKINLSSQLTTLSASVFSGCSSLKGIAIPTSVTTIKESAFQGCSSLQVVSLGVGLTTIEQNAFKDCARFSTCFVMEGNSASFNPSIESTGNAAFTAAERVFVYFESNSISLQVRNNGQSALLYKDEVGNTVTTQSLRNWIGRTSYASSVPGLVTVNASSGLLLAGDTAGSAVITATIVFVVESQEWQTTISYTVIVS